MPPTDVPSLVTVASYCSRERAYIGSLMRNAILASDLVVLTMGSRLYSGEAEDIEAEMTHIMSELQALTEPTLSKVLFVVYDVPPEYKGDPVTLHNLAREAGIRAAQDRYSGRPFWALLLDGDEVPDGPGLEDWWTSSRASLDSRTIYKMANAWAFLHPRLVSKALQDSIVLVHSDLLLPDALRHARERDGIFLWHRESGLGFGNDVRLQRLVGVRSAAAGSSQENASSTATTAGSPLFWHFSWVRGGSLSDDPADADSAWATEARGALKAKCANWGHRGQRDWNALIDEALDAIADTRTWPARDFVHGEELVLLQELPNCIAAGAPSSLQTLPGAETASATQAHQQQQQTQQQQQQTHQ